MKLRTRRLLTSKTISSLEASFDGSLVDEIQPDYWYKCDQGPIL